ncbi:MAG: phosphatase PAP2 family protein [Eubacterium sp.]|nr:phosphatase PAP2 family protein [Eubacterium sp.]
MKSKQNRIYIAFTVFYLSFFAILVAIGSFYDLKINQELFNPANPIAKCFEIWGEVPRFAMWAPAATVLLLTRHNLAECLEIINRLFPFIPKLSENAVKSRVYTFFNFVVNALEIVGFTVLAVLGWDKLIRNVGKYYVDLSKAVWYIISAVVAVIFITICSRIPKRILNRLEPLALTGILIGIFFCFESPIKSIANRVRFREMVAFSNGIENARAAEVTNALVGSSDFSLFSNWYQKGNGGAILNGFELGGGSCPSGHVISGCFSLLFPLLVSRFEKTKKFTVPACIISFIYIAFLGFTRMIRGAHFLSDIALGAIVGMLFFLIAYGALRFLETKKFLPTMEL